MTAKNGTAWSEAEVVAMRASYQTRSTRQIAEQLGRSVWAVTKRANKLGLCKTPEQIAACRRGNGVKPVMRRKFIAACAHLLAQPMGASVRELSEHGKVKLSHAKSMAQMGRRAGELFSAGDGVRMRYFASAEAAAAGLPLILAAVAELTAAAKERNRARSRAAAALRSARRRAAMPPKQAKPPKAKAFKAAPVKKVRAAKLAKVAPKPRKSDPAQAFRDRPVIVPEHVKVTVCPGIERFYAQPARVDGGLFASAGLGRYPLPATWSAGVVG